MPDGLQAGRLRFRRGAQRPHASARKVPDGLSVTIDHLVVHLCPAAVGVQRLASLHASFPCSQGLDLRLRHGLELSGHSSPRLPAGRWRGRPLGRPPSPMFSHYILRRGCYALNASVRLVHDRLSPAVIFGVFGNAVSSFSSRIHVAATRVDSWAWSDVSKRLMDVIDAFTGLDQEVATEARQLAHARREALTELLGRPRRRGPCRLPRSVSLWHTCGAPLFRCCGTERSAERSQRTRARCERRRGRAESLGGFRAWPTRLPSIARYRCFR